MKNYNFIIFLFNMVNMSEKIIQKYILKVFFLMKFLEVYLKFMSLTNIFEVYPYYDL